MKKITKIIILFFLISVLTNCNGQTRDGNKESSTKKVNQPIIGGGCDGCELMYVGMPKDINSTDTSSAWIQKGQKLLVTGTVYKLGGKIPAPNVIIYYWQTDTNGLYSPKEGMAELAKRHGHIRGWVKSDKNGKYAIYTTRPAPYPNTDMLAHIHISIKEPNLKDEYYIDEFVFEDDLLLISKKRKALENRGGSGVLSILVDQEIQVAKHNIILGLNIPNYPEKN